MNIYIAGPFSHDNERTSLKHMIELVQKRYPDANLYIPMEYKVPGDFQKLDGTWNLPNNVWAKRVFDSDIKYLNNSDLVIAMYIGHYCSSGTVWEIGYAVGRNIPVIGYIPDWAKEQDMSLMVLNGFSGYISEDTNIHKFTDEELLKFNQK